MMSKEIKLDRPYVKHSKASEHDPKVARAIAGAGPHRSAPRFSCGRRRSYRRLSAARFDIRSLESCDDVACL